MSSAAGRHGLGRCHTNSRRRDCYEAPMCNLSYHRHRFPAEVIQYAIWLYFRFPLSFRDVEDMLAERGIDVSYETVRRWALKFGAIIARKLRRRLFGRTCGGISTKCLSPSTADSCTSSVPWTAKARSWIFWFSHGETARRRSS